MGKAVRQLGLDGLNISNNYLCEGGYGSYGWGSNKNNPQSNVNTEYGLAGYASGITSAGGYVNATQTTNHTGSGGSGAFQTQGVSGGTYAGNGANGVIIISF